MSEWVKSLQLCLTLCNPMDCSPPDSSVHGILQARILEWVAIFFSRGSSWPRDRTQISHTAGRLLTLWATKKSHKQLWCSLNLPGVSKKKKKLLLWEVKGFFKKKVDLHLEEMGGTEGTMPAAVSTRVPQPGEGTGPNKQLSGVCQMALVTAAALPRVGLCYRLCGVESWIQIPFLCLWPVEQACLAQIALE